MSKKQTPSDFLKQIIGRPVVVKLNSGVDYRGRVLSQTGAIIRQLAHFFNTFAYVIVLCGLVRCI